MIFLCHVSCSPHSKRAPQRRRERAEAAARRDGIQATPSERSLLKYMDEEEGEGAGLNSSYATIRSEPQDAVSPVTAEEAEKELGFFDRTDWSVWANVLFMIG